jgi:hypothetical protein
MPEDNSTLQIEIVGQETTPRLSEGLYRLYPLAVG